MSRLFSLIRRDYCIEYKREKTFHKLYVENQSNSELIAMWFRQCSLFYLPDSVGVGLIAASISLSFS